MAKLGCGVNNCIYNKENYCCKGDIMVGGRDAGKEEETCCESFVDRKRESYTNVAERPYYAIRVDCEAVKCQYNSCYKCTADQVNIVGDNACECGDTCCATFEAK